MQGELRPGTVGDAAGAAVGGGSVVQIVRLRAVFSDDVDADLQRMAGDPRFRHRDAARHAIRFRAGGDVAELVAIHDDPHPCAMKDVVFALAGAQRAWLNWVPMPTEAVCNLANELGARRA
jgi:hypothetical protein